MNRLARLQVWLDKAIDALRWPTLILVCVFGLILLMVAITPH